MPHTYCHADPRCRLRHRLIVATVGLAERVTQGSVVALDISQDRLKLTEATMAEKGLSNIELMKADATDLHQFEGNSFDIVHAHQVLLHLSGPVKALQEMRRVLKPNGLLACRDSAMAGWYPESEPITLGLGLHYKILRARGAEPQAGKLTHVRAHEAGFEWVKMEHSGAAWAQATREEVKAWSEGMVKSIGGIALDGGFATQDEIDSTSAVPKPCAFLPEFTKTD